MLDDKAAERLYRQLDNLKIIAAVARSGSATTAGQLLFKSTSTVTRAVGAVEGTLGISLFGRGSDGFIPNVYGKLLLSRIARIEDELALAVAELARTRATGSMSRSALQHVVGNGHKLLMLIVLADSRTVAAAATALSITQSGLRMALARIEDALGVRLFYRNLQGLVPTDEASKLILCARRIRAELRHAVSELSSVASGPVGTAVVGTLPVARTDILPRAIGECLSKHPQMQIQIVEAPGAVLIAQLRAGDIDAVLSVPSANFEPAGLIVEPLFRDELVVVASSMHPLAANRMLTLEQLASWKWILPRRDSVSRRLFNSQFEKQGVEPPKAALETADLPLMRRLLSTGQMLALTSLSYLQDEIEANLLRRLSVQMEPIEREVVLLRREGTSLSPVAMSLVEEISHAARVAPASGRSRESVRARRTRQR